MPRIWIFAQILSGLKPPPAPGTRWLWLWLWGKTTAPTGIAGLEGRPVNAVLLEVLPAGASLRGSGGGEGESLSPPRDYVGLPAKPLAPPQCSFGWGGGGAQQSCIWPREEGPITREFSINHLLSHGRLRSSQRWPAPGPCRRRWQRTPWPPPPHADPSGGPSGPRV